MYGYIDGHDFGEILFPHLTQVERFDKIVFGS